MTQYLERVHFFNLVPSIWRKLILKVLENDSASVKMLSTGYLLFKSKKHFVGRKRMPFFFFFLRIDILIVEDSCLLTLSWA